MKRVITITMDIDESNHKAVITPDVTEDGKPKEKWTVVEGISTALALIEAAKHQMTEMNEFLISKMEGQK